MNASRHWRLGASALAGALIPLILSPVAAAAKGAPPRTTSSTGYDISYPQCPSNFPGGGAFGIVGVTNGLPWSQNPCLGNEWGWASARKSQGFYVNTANPGPISSHWNQGGPRPCTDPASVSDTGCAYDYGWNAAAQAFSTTSSALAAAGYSTTAVTVHGWWLDVETGNSWNGTPGANTADIEGYVDYLRAQNVPEAGIYSTGAQWSAITGGAVIGGSGSSPPPYDWVAGASSQKQATSMCSSTYSFSSGPVHLAQYPSGGYDGDYPCGGTL